MNQELVDVVIEEGRRTQDANVADLEAIRSKAQFAFTTALALVGLLAAELVKVRHHHHHRHEVWGLYLFSAALTLLALGGALAVLVNNVTVQIIHPAVLSHYRSSARKKLARDYAVNAIDWNNVIGTLRGVLREASLYLTLAALLDAALWIALHR